MGALSTWRMYDAVTAHVGGCQMCGDDDGFEPNIEAFEDTGMIICDACFEAHCEAVADD